MHARGALGHAQGAPREVAAQERQVGRRGARGLPAQVFAVGAHAPAVERAFEHEAARLRIGHGDGRVARQQGEVDDAFAVPLQQLPPALGGRRFAPRDEFEVAAVAEHDERVVRAAARMVAAAQHVEAERGVVGDGAFEVVHGDHDVVEGQGHGEGLPRGKGVVVRRRCGRRPRRPGRRRGCARRPAARAPGPRARCGPSAARSRGARSAARGWRSARP
ncbi:hypothetical protein D9M72_207840 [compost metagenome]